MSGIISILEIGQLGWCLSPGGVARTDRVRLENVQRTEIHFVQF